MTLKALPTSGTIYFLGIGGIGMSALARFFLHKGWQVHGYDRTSTSLTIALEDEGMSIHYEENPDLIPKQTDLVVYTPAVPMQHAEYQYFHQKGYKIVKRAELLGLIAENFRTIAVAGTHGKTTTTTLVAHLLKQSPLDCQAFLGGISKNYNTNLLLSGLSQYLVAEADEYDRSFLQLHPEIAVITSMDADHLDIYGDHESLKDTFISFSKNIRKGGALLLKSGLEIVPGKDDPYTLYHYSAQETGDFHINRLLLQDGLYHFDFHYPGGIMKEMVLGLPGLYNVENAVAALAAAWLCGVEEKDLRNALLSFQGVSRRFDTRIRTRRLVYIDDYAHHPEELKACISSARNLYPGKKITGIFQPHLYSRTRDFADGFAESLGLLDEVFLLPIYPARELPISGIDSGMLLQKIKDIPKHLVQKNEIPGCLDIDNIEVLLTMGAGDIDTLVAPIELHIKTSEV